MAKERRKDEPGDECPERLEGGPHCWEPGAPGDPDWCWFCEVERSDRRPEEDICRVRSLRRPHHGQKNDPGAIRSRPELLRRLRGSG